MVQTPQHGAALQGLVCMLEPSLRLVSHGICLAAGIGYKLESELAEHGFQLVSDLGKPGKARLVQLLGERVGTMVHEASLGQVCFALRDTCTCEPTTLRGLRGVASPPSKSCSRVRIVALGCTDAALCQQACDVVPVLSFPMPCRTPHQSRSMTCASPSPWRTASRAAPPMQLPRQCCASWRLTCCTAWLKSWRCALDAGARGIMRLRCLCQVLRKLILCTVDCQCALSTPAVHVPSLAPLRC